MAKARPVCSTGHAMVKSNFSEGEYAIGWNCDYCQKVFQHVCCCLLQLDRRTIITTDSLYVCRTKKVPVGSVKHVEKMSVLSAFPRSEIADTFMIFEEKSCRHHTLINNNTSMSTQLSRQRLHIQPSIQPPLCQMRLRLPLPHYPLPIQPR